VTDLSGRLLASIRELLAGYESVLGQTTSEAQPARRRADPPDVSLSAGPFASLKALREFEAAIERLPGVRQVAVRGYEGTDGAIIDVRLDAART
jgi:hypothetical protein